MWVFYQWYNTFQIFETQQKIPFKYKNRTNIRPTGYMPQKWAKSVYGGRGRGGLNTGFSEFFSIIPGFSDEFFMIPGLPEYFFKNSRKWMFPYQFRYNTKCLTFKPISIAIFDCRCHMQSCYASNIYSMYTQINHKTTSHKWK